MTSLTGARPTAAPPSALPALARQEIIRYLRHPGFWVGLALMVLGCAATSAPTTSTFYSILAAAAGLGLAGLVVMVSLTRSSDRAAEAAGAVSVPQSTRTLALAASAVVPFTVSLAWFAWAFVSFRVHPPTPNGVLFGGIGLAWVAAVMIDLGVIAAVGGPILGLVIGRWIPSRGAAPVAVVLIVLVTMVTQGIFEPLRRGRLVMPWTQFAGAIGVEGDPERMGILPGSPYLYGLYLIGLCAIGIVAAVLRDPTARSHRLMQLFVALVVVSAIVSVVAMFTGVPDTMFNPLPSSTP